MELGLREEGCIRISIAAAFAHIRNGRRIKGGVPMELGRELFLANLWTLCNTMVDKSFLSSFL